MLEESCLEEKWVHGLVATYHESLKERKVKFTLMSPWLNRLVRQTPYWRSSVYETLDLRRLGISFVQVLLRCICFPLLPFSHIYTQCCFFLLSFCLFVSFPIFFFDLLNARMFVRMNCLWYVW